MKDIEITENSPGEPPSNPCYLSFKWVVSPSKNQQKIISFPLLCFFLNPLLGFPYFLVPFQTSFLQLLPFWMSFPSLSLIHFLSLSLSLSLSPSPPQCFSLNFSLAKNLPSVYLSISLLLKTFPLFPFKRLIPLISFMSLSTPFQKKLINLLS